jgi:hypothetical protein
MLALQPFTITREDAIAVTWARPADRPVVVTRWHVRGAGRRCPRNDRGDGPLAADVRRAVLLRVLNRQRSVRLLMQWLFDQRAGPRRQAPIGAAGEDGQAEDDPLRRLVARPAPDCLRRRKRVARGSPASALERHSAHGRRHNGRPDLPEEGFFPWRCDALSSHSGREAARRAARPFPSPHFLVVVLRASSTSDCVHPTRIFRTFRQALTPA